MPEEQTLRTVLGMGPEESIDAHTAEQLVPLIKRQIARRRQQMLATTAMLGMQRIVIDSGSIVRRCAFTSTGAAGGTRTRGSTLNFQNWAKASGSFGAGPWGVSAEVEGWR